MRTIIVLSSLFVILGASHLSVNACMCPGSNPEIYPPDIPASRVYYRDEFKGAAFTGRVLSSREAPDILRKGEKIQELVIRVDRFWFGVESQTVTIYTPKDNSGCWFPFQKNESYFFIPNLEKDFLYIGHCTYATFNRKADGNFVDFMVKMFGEGRKFESKQ